MFVDTSQRSLLLGSIIASSNKRQSNVQQRELSLRPGQAVAELLENEDFIHSLGEKNVHSIGQLRKTALAMRSFLAHLNRRALPKDGYHHRLPSID